MCAYWVLLYFDTSLHFVNQSHSDSTSACCIFQLFHQVHWCRSVNGNYKSTVNCAIIWQMITFLQGVCVQDISAVLHELCGPIRIVKSALQSCIRVKNDAIIRKCCWTGLDLPCPQTWFNVTEFLKEMTLMSWFLNRSKRRV